MQSVHSIQLRHTKSPTHNRMYKPQEEEEFEVGLDSAMQSAFQ